MSPDPFPQKAGTKLVYSRENGKENGNYYRVQVLGFRVIYVYLGVSQNQRYRFGGPHNKDQSILGSISGSPNFGILPLHSKGFRVTLLGLRLRVEAGAKESLLNGVPPGMDTGPRVITRHLELSTALTNDL